MIYAVDWGDIPTWVSAGGAVTAVLFAAVAAIAAGRTYRIESARHEHALAEQRQHAASRRRAQAALVSAWWEGQARSPGVYIRNASEVPVYQGHLTVVSRRDAGVASKLDIPVLPPMSEPEFRKVPKEFAQAVPQRDDGDMVRVRLTFTDAAGVRWLRDEYGRLHELTSDLVIWAHDPIVAVLERFTTEFERAYGVDVSFEIKPYSELWQTFIDSSAEAETTARSEVDILFAPHDWTGELVDTQTVKPILLSERGQEYFAETAIDALSVDDVLYGLPAMLDTTVLYRNLDLAPHAPETLDELVDIAVALQLAGRISEVLALPVGPHGDPYHLFPLFSSAGGSWFGHSQSTGWDLTDVAVTGPESIAAFERLQALGETGAGVLRRDIGQAEATEMFLDGRAAFLVATSQVAARARDAGIRLGVSPVPPFAHGRSAQTLVSVEGFFIARHSQSPTLALDLMADFLTRPEATEAMEHNLAAAVPVRDHEPDTEVNQVLTDVCASGRLMPSGPEMPEVWRRIGTAEAQIIAGEDVQPVADQLATDLSALTLDS